MIDPIETIINHLQRDTQLMNLVNRRIATKWQAEWKSGQACIVVKLDGGPVDIYLPHNEMSLDLRCYAESQYQAMQIWNRVTTLAYATHRVAVPTRQGKALVYFLLPSAQPSFLFDTTVNSDFVYCPFRADIAQDAVD
jgi:hypothetical protein